MREFIHTHPGFITFFYVITSCLFIAGIKLQGKIQSSRLGNFISALGMLLAIATTCIHAQMSHILYTALAVLMGAGVGLWMATKVPMTAMPEMVALFNGFGGLASVLIGIMEGHKFHTMTPADLGFAYHFAQFAIGLTLIFGSITFTGSLLAYGKLSQKISGAACRFNGQVTTNLLLILLLLTTTIYWGHELNVYAFYGIILLSLIGGICFFLHIGGGDMPVIIALLNSLSGVASCTAGLIILNKVLIVAGCLVGTSGLILTMIMCKAMHRSLWQVLVGSLFIKAQKKKSNSKADTEPKPMSMEDAYYILEAAQTVAFIPGYGMAVAQAQYALKDLAQMLEKNGTDIFFAIHPVAGRMPGHMNVLLAEANVDYDQLLELERANERMGDVDVAVIVGANDVVNPAAVEQEGSPIYGMPIIEAYKAKTVLVLKRGQGKGFSGLENALFTKDNTWMVYGDAKSTLTQWVAEFKDVDA